MSGEIRPLSDVPDPVFAEKMMGDGFCVIPSSGRVVSPVSGKVVTLFPTHHAIGLRTTDGLELLVHVGVDTVKLQGEGFKPLVAEGADVQAGQPLLDVDLAQIRKQVPSVATPVVFTNLEGREWRFVKQGRVQAGDVVAQVNPPKS
jgi:glucose-specific phosphotransferase system IIA component